MRIYNVILAGMVAASLHACTNGPTNSDGYINHLSFGPGEETKIAEALLTLKDSSKVELKEGTYHFDNLSIAQLKHILIKGAGAEKTILDFSAQSQGGEGLRVTDVLGFTIDGLTLQESKGDLIKINKSEDVVVSNVRAIWQKADSASGGYAIYPVLCKRVLVENCYAQGASDAGIYVGQSDSAIVRNCKAYKNVAGCEIENTSNAKVYDNEFWGNTAGFLIFDLPDLSKRGGHVEAYNNYMHDNNERNFAKSGSFGSTWGVGNAAPGSGIIVLAASDINLHHNKIINNNSAAIAVVSGFFIDEKAAEKMNDHYFPIPRNIKIHDNEMQVADSFPTAVYAHHTGKVLVGIEQMLNAQDPSRKNARLPFITWDGITTNILTGGKGVNPDSLCISQQQPNLFVNADALNIGKPSWKPTTDVTPYVCK
ncbi:parallel beta-helix repeat-containing protein [Chitinophaga jiangningensis]|uniref:Parallel beta-helix repeat-containing protein n=1 Tax=Chitinophaga jiangningensis TaxID=1419482 RepID=A0A1M7BTK9_9BACT|nr:parallel beta-helix domain-containing protein [Chitinophaga jiangningensis]SHL58368.1 parallel beta-helix repeat-containing protein [Chitinophaga jiangningensis]